MYSFTTVIHVWTRDIVAPAYAEKRASLDKEGLAKFEAEMIQYCKENTKIKDQVRANSGQRAAIMKRELRFFNREVGICAPSEDISTNYYSRNI
jgi:hypothetical protein